MTHDVQGPRPLILTATMDDAAQAFFDAQRDRYFPPERNFLKAHITLFHALPGAAVEQIAADIQAGLSSTPFAATTSGLRFLGAGCAYTIDCAPLADLRRRLAHVWADQLTPQDAQGFRPHVTVQNKVKADVARQVFEDLQTGFEPMAFSITGLDLWHYDGGPWSPCRSFTFGQVG